VDNFREKRIGARRLTHDAAKRRRGTLPVPYTTYGRSGAQRYETAECAAALSAASAAHKGGLRGLTALHGR